MSWELLKEDHSFRDEHYQRFCQLTRDELMAILPEIAGCHPAASTLLKNKWLTESDDILACAMSEYECRTQEQQDFRRESEADRWLHELCCSVLAPLDNVPEKYLERAEAFVLWLFTDSERLYDITCVGDNWLWYVRLEDTLYRVLLKHAAGRPDYLRLRLHDFASKPPYGLGEINIREMIRLTSDDSLKPVLEAFSNK